MLGARAMTNRTTFVQTPLLVLATVVAGCGGDDSRPAPPASTSEPTQPAPAPSGTAETTPPAASSGDACVDAVRALCKRACECGGGKCRLLYPQGSEAHDSYAECAKYHELVTCRTSTKVGAACGVDVMNAACGGSAEGSGIETPASCRAR